MKVERSLREMEYIQSGSHSWHRSRGPGDRSPGPRDRSRGPRDRSPGTPGPIPGTPGPINLEL